MGRSATRRKPGDLPSSSSNKLSGQKGLGMGKFYAFLPVLLNYY